MELALRRREWSRLISTLAGGARKAALIFSISLFLLPVGMWAQDTATIVGTVTDTSGAIVPGAKVTVSNPDRGFVRDVASNSAGEYTVVKLPIGNYVVSAEVTGFQRLERSGITLTAGQTQRVDLTMTVGQITQEIKVTGQVAKVETENATVSDVVTSKQIAGLALNGNNVMGLEFLIPGAAIGNGQDSAMQLGHAGGEVTVSFNGNRNEYSQLEYDGGNNAQESSQANGGAVTPALESIAEFRISTSNYGADVGQHAGALIEMVTKGGTKDFHGGAHEFVRNQILDANDFFANRQIAPAGGNAPKTPLQWNMFGYTLGGPFYIPKVYNTSKQKTFFFWSQEWARYRAATLATGSVPTQRMRGGDFSECDPASGAYLGAANANGPGYPQYFSPANCTLPIVGGVPVDKVTPVNNNGAAFLNAYVPLPNNGPVGYVAAHKVPTNFSEKLIRVDQNISDKATLFVRFTDDSWVKETVPALWSGSSYDTTATNYIVPARQSVMHFNYSLSPTLMNEFVMSYTDTPHFIATLPGPGSISQSNLKPSDWSAGTFFPANASVKLLPSIALGSNVGSGLPFSFQVNQGNYRGPYDAEPVYTYRENLAWVHGKHTVKAGFFLEKFQLTEQFGAVTQGFYDFENTGTLTTKNALADMFLGNIQNYSEGTFNNHGVYTGGYGVGHWRRTDFEPYLQDDWKVTRRLTLNFGVRYYLLIPPHDVTHPTVDSSFIPALYNPAAASVLLANTGLLQQNPATGQTNDFTHFGNGLVECGVAPVAKGCQVPYKWNIGPRFGFAYDPTGSGKTSIRGGFGIYYEPGNGNDANTIGLEGNAPTTLAPVRFNIPGYNFGAGGFAGVGPSDLQSIPYFQKNPAVSQYNVNIEHEFRGSNVLSVAYVGTAGRHLDTNRNLNQIPIPVGTMNVPALAGVASSFCDSSGNCNVQADLMQNSGDTNYFRPYQGFGNIRQKQFTSVSSYNALQTNLRHTTGYGLTMQVAYTWSHMIDNSTSAYSMTSVDENYDMSRWKATADLNRTNVLSINYIYALPFFKHSSSAFVRQSVGGWQVSGITAIMSGPPTGFYGCGVAGYSSGIGGTYDCNPVGPLKISKSVVSDTAFGPTVQWFNPATVAQPTLAQLSANGQPGMFGYMGRNPLTGPGRNNWDLALFKDVQFPWFRGEHSTLQLRFETFNSFNHTQWLGVNTGCNGTAAADGTPAFGRSCGGSQYNAGNGEVNSAWNPRNIQLGIKYSF